MDKIRMIADYLESLPAKEREKLANTPMEEVLEKILEKPENENLIFLKKTRINML